MALWQSFYMKVPKIKDGWRKRVKESGSLNGKNMLHRLCSHNTRI